MAYPKSGKDGLVKWNGDDVMHVTNITVTRQVGEVKYASSHTGGQVSRIAGHGDKSGSFDCLEKPSFDQGDIGTLVLQEDTGGSPVTSFSGRAMIISIEETIPIEDEEGKLTYSVSWGQAPADEEGSSSA